MPFSATERIHAGIIGHGASGFPSPIGQEFQPRVYRLFAHGRNPGIFNLNTPKSLGEEVGTVKEVRGNCLTVAGVKSFANGDGLCYLDEQGKLHGFRVNRVEGNKLFPLEMPRGIRPKTMLYRNFDQEFERVMQKKSAIRKIAVDMRLEAKSFRLHPRPFR